MSEIWEGPIRKLRNCHDCNASPGQCHVPGCDTERCSVCGDQWISCGCKGHDAAFARWTGIWPGFAEAQVLGVDLNQFTIRYGQVFFVKPTEVPEKED